MSIFATTTPSWDPNHHWELNSIQLSHHELGYSDCDSDLAYINMHDLAHTDLSWLRDRRALVVDYAHEWNTHDRWDSAASRRLEAVGIPRSRQLWIFNRAHPWSRFCASMGSGRIIRYDFFAADTLWRHTHLAQEFAQSRGRGALLLTAQIIAKPQRARLLYDIWRRCRPEDLVAVTQQHQGDPLLAGMDPKFESWCVSHAHSLDRVKAWHDDVQGYARGWPADPRLWEQTGFSVVFETYAEGVEFLGASGIDCFPTEKIYRTIAMRHPFILQAEPGLWQTLEAQGYRLYHPYLPTHKLAHLAHEWLEHPQDYTEQIEHNRRVLEEHAQRELHTLNTGIDRWLESIY